MGLPNQSIKLIQNDHIKRAGNGVILGTIFLIAGSGDILQEGRPLDKLGIFMSCRQKTLEIILVYPFVVSLQIRQHQRH